MVQINFAMREVNCKIVFYGPGRSGKTTNLEQVHEKAPKSATGELISIATENDRTLYFDFLPLDLGKVCGMTTRFLLYTVPGQVYYNATRKLVLQGADGVIFVADSQSSMADENRESFQNLIENLREHDIEPSSVPFVVQWNKRDVENIDSVEKLDSMLAQWLEEFDTGMKLDDVNRFEGVAVKGEGVFKTLKSLAGDVISKLNIEHGYGKEKATSEPAAQPRVAPPPVCVVPESAEKQSVEPQVNANIQDTALPVGSISDSSSIAQAPAGQAEKISPPPVVAPSAAADENPIARRRREMQEQRDAEQKSAPVIEEKKSKGCAGVILFAIGVIGILFNTF